MKPKSPLHNYRTTTERKTNSYICQAKYRERSQYDFRIEMELIGARLRRLRMDNGYSIESIAKAIRMPKIRLHKIERGLYIHFGVSDLYKLTHHYGTSAVEILSILPDTLFDHFDY
jgi:hypothetical protein